MAVKIRLLRMGAKKRPIYRIVATDSHRHSTGKYIELVGTYNPLTNPATVTVNEEVALKWLNNGAIMSDTVRSILSKQGIVKKFAESKSSKTKEVKKEEVKEEKKETKKAPAKKTTSTTKKTTTAKKTTTKKTTATKKSTKKEA